MNPRRLTRVLLTREIIRNDEELGHAINAVLTSTLTVWKYMKEVCRRERALRNVLADEQWNGYLLIEEAMNDRMIFENKLLVRWGFEQGLRAGRGR